MGIYHFSKHSKNYAKLYPKVILKMHETCRTYSGCFVIRLFWMKLTKPPSLWGRPLKYNKTLSQKCMARICQSDVWQNQIVSWTICMKSSINYYERCLTCCANCAIQNQLRFCTSTIVIELDWLNGIRTLIYNNFIHFFYLQPPSPPLPPPNPLHFTSNTSMSNIVNRVSVLVNKTWSLCINIAYLVCLNIKKR